MRVWVGVGSGVAWAAWRRVAHVGKRHATCTGHAEACMNPGMGAGIARNQVGFVFLMHPCNRAVVECRYLRRADQGGCAALLSVATGPEVASLGIAGRHCCPA